MSDRLFQWTDPLNPSEPMLTINNHLDTNGWSGFEVGYEEDDGTWWLSETIWGIIPTDPAESGYFVPIDEINTALGTSYVDLEAFYTATFPSGDGLPASVAEDQSNQRVVRKRLSANFVKNNATFSIIDDGAGSQFIFDGLEGEEWDFEAHLFGGFGSSQDLRVRMVTPSGSSGRFVASCIENASSRGAVINGGNEDSLSVSMSSGSDDELTIRGTVILGADGNVEFHIRNNTGSNTTTIYSFSKLIATRRVA